jgi:hypothetical protein
MLQIRGISIVYDQEGKFMGYSDDKEDIARSTAAREAYVRLSIMEKMDRKW